MNEPLNALHWHTSLRPHRRERERGEEKGLGCLNRQCSTHTEWLLCWEAGELSWDEWKESGIKMNRSACIVLGKMQKLAGQGKTG